MTDIAQRKPHLSLWRIIQMNLGFLGLQFSFGLQQSNMGPIYSYLGADEANLPLLQLAGPMTGLIVQPIVGALSDRTDSKWGRRTPYFIAGAVLCSLALLGMPTSSSILMAASLLWILDAGNNITMEPYRAYVSDRLNQDQHEQGFLTQSAFTGLAQMLAFATPWFLVNAIGISRDAVDVNGIPQTVHIVFTIGAILSISTILWSILRVPELPLTETQQAEIAAAPKGFAATFIEIGTAIRDMPVPMRKLGLMSLFQWYGMFCYWTYATYSIASTVFATSDPKSAAFREAQLHFGLVGAFYNFVAFIAAFAMVSLSKRYGAKRMHALCLTIAGLGMLTLPHITDKWLLLLPGAAAGIGWGSIMGNPYVMLARCIPPARTGVYMGIFNMMIVIPMLLNGITLPFYYGPLLGSDPRNVITLAGVLLICAAWAVLRVKDEELA